MVILDTCILIELIKFNKDIIDSVYQFEQEEIFVTPVVIAEFYRGARNKEDFRKCRSLIEKFKVIPINDEVVKHFITFFETYALSHRPAVPDMLIAATAISHDISLYTLNKKDFQFIQDLKLI